MGLRMATVRTDATAAMTTMRMRQSRTLGPDTVTVGRRTCILRQSHRIGANSIRCRPDRTPLLMMEGLYCKAGKAGKSVAISAAVAAVAVAVVESLHCLHRSWCSARSGRD